MKWLDDFEAFQRIIFLIDWNMIVTNESIKLSGGGSALRYLHTAL